MSAWVTAWIVIFAVCFIGMLFVCFHGEPMTEDDLYDWYSEERR